MFASKLILSKKQLQVHTLRPRNVTHVRASALDYHLCHIFIVFEDKQMNTIAGLLRVWWNVFNVFV